MEKQLILNAFLSQIMTSIDENRKNSFWLNSRKDSVGNFKWLRTNVDLKIENWLADYPKSDSGHDYLSNNLSLNGDFGKWMNDPNSSKNYIICEFPITLPLPDSIWKVNYNPRQEKV
jgi:hypothetical protein